MHCSFFFCCTFSFWLFIKKGRKAKNIIILATSKRSIKVYQKLLIKVKEKNKDVNVLFISIGGELAKHHNKDSFIKSNFNLFDYVFVQTEKIRSSFNRDNIDNILILKNYKKMDPVTNLPTKFQKPYKLVLLSRITEDKGVFILIDSVKKVNDSLGEIAFSLDLYGPIDKSIKRQLRKQIKENSFIKYKGIVAFNSTAHVLKEYFALCFISAYKGEGFPGTFVDSFYAGLPVIANNWGSNKELIQDGFNGYIVKDETDFIKKLIEIYNNPNIITSLRENCLMESKKYTFSEGEVLFDKII